MGQLGSTDGSSGQRSNSYIISKTRSHDQNSITRYEHLVLTLLAWKHTCALPLLMFHCHKLLSVVPHLEARQPDSLNGTLSPAHFGGVGTATSEKEPHRKAENGDFPPLAP